MRYWTLLSAALLLTACKPKSAIEPANPQFAPKAAATAAADTSVAPASAPDAPAAAKPAAPPVPAPISVAQLAYSYAYSLSLPAGRIQGLVERHQQACAAAGPATCQVISSKLSSQGRDIAEGHLELRATPAWLGQFRGGLDAQARALGGRVASAQIDTEDLSRSIVDTEATIRAKTTLRDRLEKLLAERPGKLSDLVDLEQALAGVQGEIDTTQSELAVMRTRVETSKLDIDYEATGMIAPDGVASPLRRAADGFIGNMLTVFAFLVTLASYLLPLAIVGVPAGWLIMRLRPKKTAKAKPKPPE
jgi:hypothetical protein